LFGDLAKLLVAQILHLLPESQDGLSHRLIGGIGIDVHGRQVPRLKRAADGLA